MKIKTVNIQCPHCGHLMHLTLDYSQGDQDYFEDCSNCCNPIHIRMQLDEANQTLSYNVDADDEQYY